METKQRLVNELARAVDVAPQDLTVKHFDTELRAYGCTIRPLLYAKGVRADRVLEELLAGIESYRELRWRDLEESGAWAAAAPERQALLFRQFKPGMGFWPETTLDFRMRVTEELCYHLGKLPGQLTVRDFEHSHACFGGNIIHRILSLHGEPDRVGLANFLAEAGDRLVVNEAVIGLRQLERLEDPERASDAWRHVIPVTERALTMRLAASLRKRVPDLTLRDFESGAPGLPDLAPLVAQYGARHGVGAEEAARRLVADCTGSREPETRAG